MNRFLPGTTTRAATALLFLALVLFPGQPAAEFDKSSDEVLKKQYAARSASATES